MGRNAMITTFALARASLRKKMKASDLGKSKRETSEEGQPYKEITCRAV